MSIIFVNIRSSMPRAGAGRALNYFHTAKMIAAQNQWRASFACPLRIWIFHFYKRLKIRFRSQIIP